MPNLSLASPAIAYCQPGGQNFQLWWQFKGAGTQEHTTTTFWNIVWHANTNNLRRKQSEKTKFGLAKEFETARKMRHHWLDVQQTYFTETLASWSL